MRVSIAVEERFVGTPDGHVWTSMPTGYTLWRRYLEVFDAVQVVARVLPVREPPAGLHQVDGEGVSVAWLPYYVGPWQYARRAPAVHRAVREAIRRDDAAILLVGSNVGNWVAARLRQLRHPFGVEVVMDPYDAYGPGACTHRLRPLFRHLLTAQLRRQCREACAVAYVTHQALQRRYPAHRGVFTNQFVSVDLPSEAFAEPRLPGPGQHAFTLISVGMMHQLYKAPDVLIDAVAHCLREGLDLRLVLVGDGSHRAELEARADRLGLADRVRFAGQVPAGPAIRRLLDEADLFVLPSRQEGLPRALLEAMARGLPCIGSTVGGFPELLDAADLVPPDDVSALAGAIRAALTSSERLAAMAQRAVSRARPYHVEQLQARRRAFCAEVRQQTEGWQRQAPS